MFSTTFGLPISFAATARRPPSISTPAGWAMPAASTAGRTARTGAGAIRASSPANSPSGISRRFTTASRWPPIAGATRLPAPFRTGNGSSRRLRHGTFSKTSSSVPAAASPGPAASTPPPRSPSSANRASPTGVPPAIRGTSPGAPSPLPWPRTATSSPTSSGPATKKPRRPVSSTSGDTAMKCSTTTRCGTTSKRRSASSPGIPMPSGPTSSTSSPLLQAP